MSRVRIYPRVQRVSGRVLMVVEDASVQIVQPGSTTQVPVYAASSGGSPLTQPFTTNDRGELDETIWVDSGQPVETLATFTHTAPGGTQTAVTGREQIEAIASTTIPAGGTSSQVLTKQPDGSNAWAAAPAGGGGNAVRSGNRIFYIGDSITAYSISNGITTPKPPLLWERAWPMWAEFADRRVQYAGLSANGGYTVAQVRDTHLPIAVAAAPTHCVVLAGRNDVLGPVPFATTISAFTTIFTTLLNAGIIPVVCVPPASGQSGSVDTAAQKLAKDKIANWLRSYASRNNLPLVDMALITTDAATGYWKAGYNADVSHPVAVGAQAMGNALAAQLGPLLPPWEPPKVLENTDLTSSLNQIANPLLLIDSNADGIPDGWTNTGTAGITGTAIDAAAAATDGIRGNWLKLKRSGGTGAAIISSDPFTVVPGDRVGYGFVWKTITASTTVSVRLMGPAGEPIAGPSQWDASVVQVPISRWYQEAVVPAGITQIHVDLVISGNTGTLLYVGEFGMWNLTQSGVLS